MATYRLVQIQTVSNSLEIDGRKNRRSLSRVYIAAELVPVRVGRKLGRESGSRRKLRDRFYYAHGSKLVNIPGDKSDLVIRYEGKKEHGGKGGGR